MTPFRVFSGWDSRQAEAAEVFAYSVRENSSVDLDLRHLKLEPHGVFAEPGAPEPAIGDSINGFQRRGTTDFSYSRFCIPALCGYEGVAAFFDGCDQLCLGDVAELASFDLQDRPLAVVKHPSLPGQGRQRARSWSSVMLLDCSRLQWWTPAFVETASDAQLMRFADLADEQIGELPSEWNVLCEIGGALVDQAGRVMTSEDPLQGKTGLTYVEWEPPSTTKLLHWSYLSQPEGGSWIDRSGSTLWAEWRERWRASR